MADSGQSNPAEGNTMAVVVLLQIISTFLLTGLTWYVQLVHYPLFHFIPKADFKQFHLGHVTRTNLIVLTFLPIEVFTSAITAYYGFPGLSHNQWILGFLVSVAICLCTIVIQMPLHAKLSQEKTDEVIDRLVLSHWIRTALWSMRVALLGGMILRLVSIPYTGA